jgi:hypothetical protein
MEKHAAPVWSAALQQQTRDAIEQLPLTPDGKLHFKHPTLGGACASLNDLLNDQLLLQVKMGGDLYQFVNVEALLQAGWALD